MAKGDLDGLAIGSMATRHATTTRADFERAKDALRVAPQLAAAELQFCIAFGLCPFAYLSAKLASGADISAERQERIRSEEFRAREDRQRESWSGHGLTRDQLDQMRVAGQR